jgi:putative DNA primase/helicase
MIDPETIESASAAYRKQLAANGSNGHHAPKQAVASPDDFHFTDLGNARRVIQRHGADLHFCHPWKLWYVWGGSRWKEDDTAEVVRRVKETQSSLFLWAAGKLKESASAGDEVQANKLQAVLSHCTKWQSAKAIRDCLDLMRSEPSVPILPVQLDADQWLFNCENGTLDLRTGELRDHQRDDYLTKLSPVRYDPNAECPLWLKFLGRIMDGNGVLVAYLQRVVGCCLTGDVSEQCLWFLHGAGSNGKSTFLATLLALWGDYGMQAVSELLLAKSHEAHPTERADLMGKRLVATIETDQGKRLAEALMKQMTGGDKIRARKMRQDFFEFDPTHKLFLAANHKPTVRGQDHAAWRRIKLVPFGVTISEAEKDQHLPEKLKAELSGILAWAVRGCLDWQRFGMEEPDEVKAATAAYQAEQDLLAGFLADACFMNPEARCKSSALYSKYQEWSADHLTTTPEFRRRLEDKGYVCKKSEGAIWWLGIGLPSQE